MVNLYKKLNSINRAVTVTATVLYASCCSLQSYIDMYPYFVNFIKNSA